MSQTIAFVGGGHVGAEPAKALNDTAQVILIEPRSHFGHAPAKIRAVVDPSLVDRALIPYVRLLTSGRHLASQATGIDGNSVTLDDGTRVEADQIVVATESVNAMLFMPQGVDIAGLKAGNQRIHQQLKRCGASALSGNGGQPDPSIHPSLLARQPCGARS